LFWYFKKSKRKNRIIKENQSIINDICNKNIENTEKALLLYKELDVDITMALDILVDCQKTKQKGTKVKNA
jgi:hypothetical protein